MEVLRPDRGALLELLLACSLAACTSLSLDDLQRGASSQDGGDDAATDGAVERSDGGDGDGGDGDGDGDGEAPQPRCDEGKACALTDDLEGMCLAGECVQCANDDDCAPTGLTCREAYCTEDHTCSTRIVEEGTACEGGYCSDAAECVDCAIDDNCEQNEVCEGHRCACKPGFVANAGDEPGCNLDECALEDDNRCATPGGNTCANTDEGYTCACEPPWKLGETDAGPQCFQGGDGTMATVTNGATWLVSPNFVLACSNVFADPLPAGCAVDANNDALLGNVVWLNLCALGPPPCNKLGANTQGLLSTELQRVTYSAPLESYGDPTGEFTNEIQDPAAGDVILVRTLSTLGVMRIMSVGTEMTFEWASVWRDHCFLEGGATCTAECNCPGAP